jgi:pimeloyl-ACP methyl ester carboxylesterase
MPPPRERSQSGHIGLIVLGSIVAGLVLGLVLVLGVFGGSEEATITGAALISLGAGMLILFLLAERRTDRPQPWALAPAISLGAIGFALLIIRPGDRLLSWMGWVWPMLLALLVVWSVRGARRSLPTWSRRWLLYPALAVLGLVALGGAYETVAETTSNPAPSTGRTFLVEGHRLYLNCVGSGSPTVVLFNGLGERTPNWAWVQSAVARQTRVCAYDRAGQGWSGKAPGHQDGHQLAADLHGLLSAADVPGPYVVAGHSVGGTYALAYAMDYPKETAGVALIDSASPHQFEELPDYPGFYSMWRRVGALLPSVGRAGVPRLTSGLGSGELPHGARSEVRAFNSSPRELRANRDEFNELRTVFDQTKALTSLEGKPLFVLTAGQGQQSGWSAAQDKLATLSTNSRHQTAEGATHAALLEAKDFASVTSGAISEVVQAARSGETIR